MTETTGILALLIGQGITNGLLIVAVYLLWRKR